MSTYQFPLTCLYGNYGVLSQLGDKPRMAVLVCTDNEAPYPMKNDFGAWLQMPFMDITPNPLEARLWHMAEATSTTQWAQWMLNTPWMSQWSGRNGFPYRPFTLVHAQRIWQWLAQTVLTEPRIQQVGIYCEYGKSRSRALAAVLNGAARQGNPWVYDLFARTRPEHLPNKYVHDGPLQRF